MSEPKHTISDLYQMQSLPLSAKIRMTKYRLREWVDEYGEDGVYVSFSGGKDSAVLLHIARGMYPDIKAAFVDTGLEYPEIRQFVKTFDNVDWLKPKMNFRQVIEKYGYPFISKEVAECVYGARKFLSGGGYEHFFRKLNAMGEYASRGGQCKNTGDRIATVRNISANTTSYADAAALINPTAGGQITSIENSEELENIPVRMKMLLGILTKDNQIATETTPDKDRSRFNCSRYKFFLDDGAPEISHMCCNVMKKSPTHTYGRQTGRKPITAQTASESRLRTQQWLKNGCNGFDMKNPISNPMSFWAEQDVLLYIHENHLPIASVYGDVVIDYEGMGQLDGQMSFADYGIFDTERPLLKTTGCDRTGCVFCGFGCHLEKGQGRFERLKETHPNLYEYIMKPWEDGGLNYKEVIDWINEHGNLNIKY